MSYLRMIDRHATEEQAEKAVARLKPMIEAADASNQDGEDAVVNVIHAYDHFGGLVKCLKNLIEAVGKNPSTWTIGPVLEARDEAEIVLNKAMREREQ